MEHSELQEKYFTVPQVAELLTVSESYIQKICRWKKIKGCLNIKRTWYLPKDAVTQFKAEQQTRFSPINKNSYYTLQQASDILGKSIVYIAKMCRQGRMRGAIQVAHKAWLIPKSTVDGEKPIDPATGQYKRKNRPPRYNAAPHDA